MLSNTTYKCKDWKDFYFFTPAIEGIKKKLIDVITDGQAEGVCVSFVAEALMLTLSKQ